jgi:N-formylglutamate deformylase
MQLYKVIQPKNSIPIIVNIPHSWTYIPSEIKKLMTPEVKKALYNCDRYLFKLYDFLPKLGITVMYATHSRYVIDTNRDPNASLYGDFSKSLIAQETALWRKVYTKNPSHEELQKRVSRFYNPYHKKLKELINDLIEKHKKIYLFDLHSFMWPITNDICLWNANGKTCSVELINHIANAFKKLWYDTVSNDTYTGGYITRHYSNIPNLEVLQIEIRYTTYLDKEELDLPRKPKIINNQLFDLMKENLNKIFENIKSYVKS